MSRQPAAILNANTNAAIYWCQEHPEEWGGLLDEAVAKTLNWLEHVLAGEKTDGGETTRPVSHELADMLLEKGIVMYPQLIAMLIRKKLEKTLDRNVEGAAGMLLAEGFTKRSLAFFMDTSPSNLNVRYPHLDELAAAHR